MTNQHRAKPEQWEHVEICAGTKQIPWATNDCILELRARVEALEAAPAFRVLETGERIQMNIVQDKLDRLIALDAADPTPDPAMDEPRAASVEAQPAGGLVERVANAISEGDEPDKWHPEARDAIREVAAWLSEHTDDDASAYWAARLEQEADRG
jgi:hypothetical protein